MQGKDYEIARGKDFEIVINENCSHFMTSRCGENSTMPPRGGKAP